MKKTIIAAVVLFTLAACNSVSESKPAADSTAVKVDSVKVDSVAAPVVDSTAAVK